MKKKTVSALLCGIVFITMLGGCNSNPYYTVSFDMGGHGTAIAAKSISKAVTGYTYSPDGALTVSDNKITVSYTEGGITCTAEQAITVTESGEPALVSLNSISINTAPIKTVYTEGEKFDPAGMVVSANYTDGSSFSEHKSKCKRW